MSLPGDNRTIALARLPSLLREAARDFERSTGLTVVTTLGTASPDRRARGRPSPPVHPLCAKLLRQAPKEAPCDAQWRKHIRSTARTRSSRIHTCPLGLRCAGVPIVLGDELLGVAKVVAGPEISKGRFRSLAGMLEVLISRPCQDLHVLLLKERINTLQESVDRLRLAKQPPVPAGKNANLPVIRDGRSEGSYTTQTLINQVLDHLSAHYADSRLSLIQVATAVGKNEKYVAHLFAQQVGERMRTYITTLRVRRACELLLETSRTIEEIARDSGFAHPARFRQSFRRTIGVTASEYRQIFTAGV